MKNFERITVEGEDLHGNHHDPESIEQPDSAGPLDGVIVADFTRVLAGPYCTMLLADMGATVIKVEGPNGDDTRTWKPPSRGDESTYYLSVNRNKHAITLDLNDADDLDTAYQLLDHADVFVENFRPGGLKRFGLDPDSVSHRWPEVIHASITGFGTAGGSHLPGYDMIIQATSGLMSITGSPEGHPQKAGVAMFDVMTGLHTAIGILGALHERKESGQGQHVGTNLLSSAQSGLVNQTAAFVAGDTVPERLGSDHPSVFPYGPFQARDRAVVIACGNHRQFEETVRLIGAPELAADPRFATMSERGKHREELRKLMEEQLQLRDAADWVGMLQTKEIPCSLILGIDEGVRFAESIGLQPIQLAGDIPTIKHPIDFSRTPARYGKAPPHVNEDEDYIRNLLEK